MRLKGQKNGDWSSSAAKAQFRELLRDGPQARLTADKHDHNVNPQKAEKCLKKALTLEVTKTKAELAWEHSTNLQLRHGMCCSELLIHAKALDLAADVIEACTLTPQDAAKLIHEAADELRKLESVMHGP